MANKKYTQEFKDSTVQLILNNNEKATTIASDLDLNLKRLYAWINIYIKANNIPNLSNSFKKLLQKKI